MTESLFLNNDYTLQVGKNGLMRLVLLNELINPKSLDFIDKVTDLTNKKILEVGCGTGIMAAELALKCLPHGSVLATDISEEQLKIAAETSAQSNVSNIHFLQLAANDIDSLNTKFDIIYFRLVLGHLPNVLEILRKVIILMHAESFLICEEIKNVDVMYCDPSENAFDWWKLALDCQIKSVKGDFTVGKNLSDFFQQSNLQITHFETVQPILSTARIKQQLWMGIVEISPILIASGFATQIQINQMISALKKLADSPLTKVGFFSLQQIAGKTNAINSIIKAKL